MDIITTFNLTKKYNKVTAVDALNLTIKKSEIFGLLGPNGAGKTTMLMMLSTLLKPTSGSAVVNGFDVMKEPARVRSSIGMVFQDPSSDIILTGYENLKLHALMYNMPLNAIDRKIDEVLTLVDLEKRKHDRVKTYSGGMKRRMEIARGLLHTPDILFLDEPTLGLDPQTRTHIWNYIESLAQHSGMTIVLTTHYMEEAEKLCNRIAIIDHGSIAILDTPDNLKRTTGGDRVILKGKKINLELISKLPYIKQIDRQDDRVHLFIENSGKNLQELLCSAGELEFVEVHPQNLNDVFLHVTGREIRDEEEDGNAENFRTYARARDK